MPSAATFSIKPISLLLDRWLHGRQIILDPFARDSRRGTHRNDLRDIDGVEALTWLESLTISADVVLFDPPYSPRQISEVYKSVGLDVSMQTTQSSFYTARKNAADKLLKVGGLAICFGWNSGGMGINRGYRLEEILLVNHGGAHNDTIVTVETKL